MASKPLAGVVRYLHRISGSGGFELTDADLVALYASQREPDAFEAIVRRHASLVLGVCRRVLGSGPDVDDAFQATFLVLARKAHAIRRSDSVGSWLHGVAFNMAKQLRKKRAIVHRHETSLAATEPSMPMSTDPVHQASLRELGAVLDEELQRLPAVCRAAIVACHLEGASTAEAARLLGVPASTLKSRLLRGRELLRKQLERRGVGLSAVGLVVLLVEQSKAGVTSGLVRTTVEAAVSFAGSGAILASNQVVGLALNALKITAAGKLKMTVLAVLTVGLVGLGAAAVVSVPLQSPPAPSAQGLTRPNQASVPQSDPPQRPRVDLHGDPLPKGAVARIGTTRFLQGNGHLAFPIAYTPDGKQLLSCDAGKAVVFWDAATGKELRRITVEDGDIATFVLSPDATTLAIVGKECSWNVRLWDLAGFKQVHQIPSNLPVPGKHVEKPPSVAFFPDGKTFAASRSDGAIRLWDVGTWKEKPPLPTGGSNLEISRVGVPKLHFCLDGKTMISAADGICWRDMNTSKEIRRVDAKRAFLNQWTLAFSPDGKRLAAVVELGTVVVGDALTGEEISRTLLAAWDKQTQQTSCCLCFSPDSKILVCHARGGNFVELVETVFFAAETGKEVRRWAEGSVVNRVSHMAFSPDGKTLALGGGQKAVDLRDAETGKPVLDMPGLTSGSTAVQFTQDGKAISTNWRGNVALWDSLNGKQLGLLTAPPAEVTPVPVFGSTCFTADCKKAATINQKGKVMTKGVVVCWDSATSKILWRTNGLECSDPVFSPDGKLLAVNHDDEMVCLLDTATGKVVNELRTKRGFFRAFSQDGRLLATATMVDETGPVEMFIRVWDTVTGKMVTKLILKDKVGVRRLVFAADGKALVSYHDSLEIPDEDADVDVLPVIPLQGSFRLWDIAKGQEIRRVPTESVCFQDSSKMLTPDFKTVATASGEDVVLTELATGKTRGIFSGHRGYIHSLSISPDGILLVSGSSDRTGLVWDITGICPDGKWTPQHLPVAQIKRLWADLAGDDAVAAYRAMWKLAAAPETLPFLAEQMRPAASVEMDRLVRLIADLGSDDYKLRSRATAELQQLRELARPVMLKTWAGQPTLEMRQRLELLLKSAQTLSAKDVQDLRALEVLENSRTAGAFALLETLAAGAPDARLTQEANECLERIKKR